jgi:hypothetical protein
MLLIQASPEIRELDLNAFRLALKDQEDSEAGMTFPDMHRHNTEVELAGVTYARVVEIINDYTVTFEDGQYAVSAVGANSNLADVMNVNQVSLRTANAAGLIVTVSGSGVTEQDKLDIADRVWDEQIDEHVIIDTFGQTNQTATSVTEQDKLDIADRVWDEQLDEHDTADTFGLTNQTAVPSANIEDYRADLSGIDSALTAIQAAITGMNNSVDFIKAIEGGRWKIDAATNKMIFYAEDNITEVAQFALKDAEGQPAHEGVFERVRQ